MSTKIIIKKSSTAGAAPLIADLDQGELAVNLADRKLYIKNNSNAIVSLDGAYVDSVAPGAPSEGDLWYDTANNLLKAYNGSAWLAAGYIYTGGAGIDITGTVISHADTSTQVSVNNSGATFVQDVTLDTYGHITGLVSSTLTLANLGVTATAAELNTLDGITATVTELNYADGVTSNIQTQLNNKSDVGHTHTVSELSDTTITTVADNEVLAYDSTSSKWINQTAAEAGLAVATHTHTLGQASDVTISAVADNELLAYNSGTSTWINQTPAEAGFATVATSGAYADLSGTPTIGNGTQTITAGTGLSGGGSFTANQTGATSVTLNVDLNELTTSVVDGDGDFFAVVDTAGAQKKLTKGSINISGFNNDAGYLNVESDTLATVTGRGATTGTAVTITNATASTNTTTGALKVTGGVGIGGALNVGGNTIIGGNLTVNGTTTSVNSNTVNIGDNIIILNADEAGVPSQNAGFEVERGTSVNVAFLWDEAADAWDMGGYNLQSVVVDGGTY